MSVSHSINLLIRKRLHSMLTKSEIGIKLAMIRKYEQKFLMEFLALYIPGGR
jgi:hypothetical protein